MVSKSEMSKVNEQMLRKSSKCSTGFIWFSKLYFDKYMSNEKYLLLMKNWSGRQSSKND